MGHEPLRPDHLPLGRGHLAARQTPGWPGSTAGNNRRAAATDADQRPEDPVRIFSVVAVRQLQQGQPLNMIPDEIGPGIGPGRFGRHWCEAALGLQHVNERGEIFPPERRIP